LSEHSNLTNNSIMKHMDGFAEMNDELQAEGLMWYRQQYEDWLHRACCKRKHHSTPWLTDPPYTCEALGVRWDNGKMCVCGEEESNMEQPNVVTHSSSGSQSLPSNSSEETDTGSDKEEEYDEEEEERQPRQRKLEQPNATPRAWSWSQQKSQTGPPAADSVKAPAAPDRSPRNSNGSTRSRSSSSGSSRRNHVEKDVGNDVEPCENLWDTAIWPQIQHIVANSLRSAAAKIRHRKNSYELLGYDLIICPGPDEEPKVWLLEVNKCPALTYSSPIKCPLVKKLAEDTMKVIIDVPRDPHADTGEWEPLPSHVIPPP